jgi:hypothetical protein
MVDMGDGEQREISAEGSLWGVEKQLPGSLRGHLFSGRFNGRVNGQTASIDAVLDFWTLEFGGVVGEHDNEGGTDTATRIYN